MNLTSTETRTLPQEADALEIRDVQGHVLVRYDTANRKVVLSLPDGEVEIASADGKIRIKSPQTLCIESDGCVELHGARGVVIGDESSGLRVLPNEVRLASPALEARIGATDYAGERIQARATEVKVKWGKLEQVVGRLFSWARAVYERIEGLHHTRAGRVRTEAERSYLVQSERARIQSKGDMRIQGRTINLG